MCPVHLGQGAYIHLKAQLAQYLLRDAWARTRAGEASARPWPWADMWLVARLQVPAHNVDLFVLSDATGRTLAFGPGHHLGTAVPGMRGVTMLSAHRDTHFAFLQFMRPGDRITLDTADGTSHAYTTTAIHITEEPTVRVQEDARTDMLVLATCYPFDAVTPGGPQRYLVIAEPVETNFREENPDDVLHEARGRTQATPGAESG